MSVRTGVLALGRVVLPALAGAVLLASGSAQERAWPARVGLEGPLERVELDWGPAAGRTLLVGPLVAGEGRTVVAPAPVDRPRAGLVPRVVVDGVEVTDDPRVRLLGWPEDLDPEAPLTAAERGLRRRPRPPVGRGRGGLGTAGWALLLAGGVLGLALRRRPATAAALGAVLAVGILALGGGRATGAPTGVSVLEGLAAEGGGGGADPRWVRVEGAYGELTVDPSRLLALEVDPVDAPITWRVDLSGDARTPTVSGERVALHAVLVPDGSVEVATARNGWRPLAAVWVRVPPGGFENRGPWPVDAPLPPEPLPAGEVLPGWLAGGLPQGVGVLVGRVAVEGSEPPTWVRIVGPLGPP